MTELFKRIRQRREELGMSQDELAKKIGYKSRSSINKIEKGITDISQLKIELFAKALETTPAYLMGWEDSDSLTKNNGKNTIKIAGRDGTYVEKNLSDAQVDLIQKMIEQMPDVDDL